MEMAPVVATSESLSGEYAVLVVDTTTSSSGCRAGNTLTYLQTGLTSANFMSRIAFQEVVELENKNNVEPFAAFVQPNLQNSQQYVTLLLNTTGCGMGQAALQAAASRRDNFNVAEAVKQSGATVVAGSYFTVTGAQSTKAEELRKKAQSPFQKRNAEITVLNHELVPVPTPGGQLPASQGIQPPPPLQTLQPLQPGQLPGQPIQQQPAQPIRQPAQPIQQQPAQPIQQQPAQPIQQPGQPIQQQPGQAIATGSRPPIVLGPGATPVAQPNQPGQQNLFPGQPTPIPGQQFQPGQPIQQQPGQPIHQQPGQPIQQPGQPIQQPGQPIQRPGQPIQQPGNQFQQPGQPIQQPGQPIQQQPGGTGVRPPIILPGLPTPAPGQIQPTGGLQGNIPNFRTPITSFTTPLVPGQTGAIQPGQTGAVGGVLPPILQPVNGGQPANGVLPGGQNGAVPGNGLSQTIPLPGQQTQSGGLPLVTGAAVAIGGGVGGSYAWGGLSALVAALLF